MANECFVIMPIGNPETEFLWNAVYNKVAKLCGVEAKRIDKIADGTTLPGQIIDQIQSTPLIIADLTLARPNCYFEIGYAMGLGKHLHWILCCREDHNPDSPDYQHHHKVHFDIQSHDIIWWNKKNLSRFRSQLEEYIERRKKQGVYDKIPTPEEPRIVKPIPAIPKQASNFNVFLEKSRKEFERWKEQT
jgi:hypothetical protein